MVRVMQRDVCNDDAGHRHEGTQQHISRREPKRNDQQRYLWTLSRSLEHCELLSESHILQRQLTA